MAYKFAVELAMGSLVGAWALSAAAQARPMMVASVESIESTELGESGEIAAAPEAVKELHLKAGDGLPVETWVYYPAQVPGQALGVVLMNHGFLLSQRFYHDVLTRIAAKGFVVIAPQTIAAGGLPIGKPNASVEEARSVATLTWMAERLSQKLALPLDFSTVALVNHSRGGKVAWLLLREHGFNVKAVAAIDPIDGDRDGTPSVTGSFKLDIPALIIGTGLGSKAGFGGQACAPVQMNYQGFWSSAAQSPSWLMIANDYGHVDVLDDHISCGLVCQVCPSAGKDKPKSALRAWVGTTIGAFLRGVLYHDASSLDAIGQNPDGLSLRTEQR